MRIIGPHNPCFKHRPSGRAFARAKAGILDELDNYVWCQRAFDESVEVRLSRPRHVARGPGAPADRRSVIPTKTYPSNVGPTYLLGGSAHGVTAVRRFS